MENSSSPGPVLREQVKSVEPAPQHEGPDLPENVTARELLGLDAQFTKADLRSAWLRLARELHPDRWMTSGPAVRRMKEAGSSVSTPLATN